MKKYYFDTLDSTNQEAKRTIRRGESGCFYVVADSQTSGRGQFEREFYSPPGGLYMSVCLTSGIRPDNACLTQAAAVAVCEAVEEMCGVRLGIKPVNDIIYKSKKAGGILVETTASHAGGDYYAVFGIGLNFREPPGGFPARLSGIAGHIFEHEVDRGALAEIISQRIFEYSKNFGSAEITGKYIERLVPHEGRN
ncbi:MAG TPA: biotin--[acetyl-CoA-carboxylase] ligase [Clostridiales bacterium]|jgi:BirA family biotin operon repressor/biotin-[acetyl-CoA-carboxylase] ligase|nr:biotin--[acetyl-CoA-carboxylase] ligase [Clostridiales bacterium]